MQVCAVVSKTTNPGAIVTFPLYVKNTSDGQDAYNLAFGIQVADDTLSNPGILPTGWTVTFKDPNNGNSVVSQTGNLASGASKQFTAEVFVPAGYAPGTVDIYFRALSSTTNAEDIIHDAVNVNTEQNIQLTSNSSGQVAPGGSRNYLHTLTILSNVTENNGTNSDLQIELSNSKPVGWTASVYWDVDGNGSITSADSLITTAAASGSVDFPVTIGSLVFNQQVKFIVKVTGLNGLDDGETNTTTITISDGNDPAALASRSNTDLTEVQAGLLVIDKFQAPADEGSAGDYTKNPFNVLPGDTVYYQLVVRNDGSQPVTTVSITDDTPSFTKMLVAASATVTSGSLTTPPTVTQPAVGAAGTITVDINQLDPTEEVTITFAVKVNN